MYKRISLISLIFMLQIVVVTNIFSLTIYVTEDDKDYNSNLTVAKYENGIWTPLTQTDQTQFYGASPVVKVDSKNIPYLLFSLHRKYGSPYASKLFCYNNGGWQNDNPFIQTNKTDSMAEDDAIYSFIIGSDDRFCFLRSIENQIRLYQFYPSKADNLSSGLEMNFPVEGRFMLDKNDQPIVVVEPPLLAGQQVRTVQIKKMENKKWIAIGNRQFPSDQRICDIVFNKQGDAYLLIADSVEFSLSVLELKDGKWAYLGKRCFTDKYADLDTPRVWIDSNGNINVVALTRGNKISAFRFVKGNWENYGKIEVEWRGSNIVCQFAMDGDIVVFGYENKISNTEVSLSLLKLVNDIWEPQVNLPCRRKCKGISVAIGKEKTIYAAFED